MQSLGNWLMEGVDVGIKKFKVPLSALVGICTSHMKMLKEIGYEVRL